MKPDPLELALRRSDVAAEFMAMLMLAEAGRNEHGAYYNSRKLVEAVAWFREQMAAEGMMD